MAGVACPFGAIGIEATDAAVGPGFRRELVGGIRVDYHLATVAGLAADNGYWLSTGCVGEVGICGGEDFTGMSMIRGTGLFFYLLMAFAAIFRRDQSGNCFTIVLEGIDIACLSAMAIKAANIILAMSRILPL